MWDDRVMATPLDVQNLGTREAFVDGRVAMVEDGSWALKDILADAGFRIGVAPLPAGAARRVTLATTDGFGLYCGTRHPEAAWSLMKFLISPDYGLAMARANYLQPARASLVEEWMRVIRADFPEKSRGVDLSVFAQGHLVGYSAPGETFADMGAARKIADEVWEEIFTLGQVGTVRAQETDGREVLAAFAPVSGTPWNLATELDRGGVARRKSCLSGVSGLAPGMGLLVPLAVVALGLQRITRPGKSPGGDSAAPSPPKPSRWP